MNDIYYTGANQMREPQIKLSQKCFMKADHRTSKDGY
jgi:hypothetical protein